MELNVARWELNCQQRSQSAPLCLDGEDRHVWHFNFHNMTQHKWSTCICSTTTAMDENNRQWHTYLVTLHSRRRYNRNTDNIQIPCILLSSYMYIISPDRSVHPLLQILLPSYLDTISHDRKSSSRMYTDTLIHYLFKIAECRCSKMYLPSIIYVCIPSLLTESVHRRVSSYDHSVSSDRKVCFFYDSFLLSYHFCWWKSEHTLPCILLSSYMY